MQFSSVLLHRLQSLHVFSHQFSLSFNNIYNIYEMLRKKTGFNLCCEPSNIGQISFLVKCSCIYFLLLLSHSPHLIFLSFSFLLNKLNVVYCSTIKLEYRWCCKVNTGKAKNKQTNKQKQKTDSRRDWTSIMQHISTTRKYIWENSNEKWNYVCSRVQFILLKSDSMTMSGVQ